MLSRNNNLIYLIMVYKDRGLKVPPFPLMLLSNVLKKNGFDTKVIHCTENEIAQVTGQIINDTPLFVGFSVLTGLPTLYSATMSKSIKEKNKHIPVVWGGVHPSLLGEQCLSEEYIDYIVQGEGEIAVVEMAKCLRNNEEPKNVPGVGYKINNEAIINQKAPFIKNLDDYDFDFNCVNLNDYIYLGEYDVRGKKVKAGTLGYYSSRGCPHNCGFCFNLVHNKRMWRNYSAEKTINDIEFLKKNYNVECIDFWDDNFFTNRKRAIQILESIKCYSKIEIRIDYINEELAQKLTELGVVYMLIGGESGSDRVLKFMNKGFTGKKLLEGAVFLDKYNLTAQYSFVLGIPSETKEELYETINLMYKISKIHRRSSFTVGLYLPYPGTELYQKAVKRGFQPPKNSEDWNTLDRWRNTVELPWINNKVSLNIRHLFAMLGWSNPLVRWWAGFRIKHMILNMDFDLKVIIKAHSEAGMIKEKIKNLINKVNNKNVKYNPPGIIYKFPKIYSLAMRILYGANYKDRYRAISEYLPENSSVVDVCCGDAELFKYLKDKKIDYTGIDISSSFIRTGLRKGIKMILADAAHDKIPETDYIVLQGSLYQFENPEDFIEKLFKSAKKGLIIAEPIVNLANRFKNGLLGFVVGTNHQDKYFRFNEKSFRAVINKYNPQLKTIRGGREMVAFIKK